MTYLFFVLGEKIKKARKNKGYTLKELGEIIDISHAALSQIENDKNNVSKKTLIALAKTLGNNFGETWLDEYMNGTLAAPSKKEIIEDASVEEIFTLKFGGKNTRRSTADIIKMKKLLDREIEKMINEQ